MNELDTLIEQAINKGIFLSYGEAIVCASITSPIVMGRQQPTLEDLKRTVEIRRKHKKELLNGLWST